MTTTVFMWIIVAHIILYWLTSFVSSIMRGMSENDKLENIMLIRKALNEVKENKAARKTDGRKSRIIKGIPKLIDANKAGGPDSGKCSLILCEGDSAKAGVMSGLSKIDRDWYGIFPLKGKLLNTLDASQTKINNNAPFRQSSGIDI